MNTAHPRPNALIWLALSIFTIVVDQLSKAWVLSTLPEFTPVTVIDGFWNWYRTYNKGAAFSFLNSASGWQHYLFIVLAVAISGVLLVMLSRTSRRDWLTAMPFALIIGGALGNVIDRIRYGHVVDFIQWYYKGFVWPSFNVADSAIFLGAILLIVGSLFRKPSSHEVVA